MNRSPALAICHMAYASRNVKLPRQSIADLRDKYAQMVAMRFAHSNGTEDCRSVRSAMAALARKFPGSLREIDRLALPELQARLAKLDDVLRGETGVEPWMVAVARFHELMRGALTAKRWLNGHKRVGANAMDAFARDLPHLAFPEDARVWLHQLDAIAAPPRGQVTTLVYAELANVLGTSCTEARRLAFGGTSA